MAVGPPRRTLLCRFLQVLGVQRQFTTQTNHNQANPFEVCLIPTRLAFEMSAARELPGNLCAPCHPTLFARQSPKIR